MRRRRFFVFCLSFFDCRLVLCSLGFLGKLMKCFLPNCFRDQKLKKMYHRYGRKRFTNSLITDEKHVSFKIVTKSIKSFLKVFPRIKTFLSERDEEIFRTTSYYSWQIFFPWLVFMCVYWLLALSCNKLLDGTKLFRFSFRSLSSLSVEGKR